MKNYQLLVIVVLVALIAGGIVYAFFYPGSVSPPGGENPAFKCGKSNQGGNSNGTLPPKGGIKPTFYGQPHIQPPLKISHQVLPLPVAETTEVTSKFIDTVPFLVCSTHVSPVPHLWLVDVNSPRTFSYGNGETGNGFLRFYGLDGHALHLSDVNFETTNLSDVYARFWNPSNGATPPRESFGGIIGLDVLKRFQIEIDWPFTKIEISPVTRKPIGVQLKMISSSPVAISGNMGTFPKGPWGFSTTFNSSISSDFAKQYGLAPPPGSVTVDLSTGITEGAPVIGNINMDDGEIRTNPISLSIMDEKEWQGLVGLDLLRSWSMTLDFLRGKVVIKY